MNRITEAGRRIYKCKKESCDVLDLDGLELSSLTDLSIPKGLRVLKLNHNRLTSLPDSLPDNLKILHCEYNQLTSLPDKLPKELVWLNCAHNRLTYLPESLPAKLGVLYCHDNQLSSLPTNLPRGLSWITWENNPLTRFPDLPPLIQNGKKEYLQLKEEHLKVSPLDVVLPFGDGGGVTTLIDMAYTTVATATSLLTKKEVASVKKMDIDVPKSSEGAFPSSIPFTASGAGATRPEKALTEEEKYEKERLAKIQALFAYKTTPRERTYIGDDW